MSVRTKRLAVGATGAANTSKKVYTCPQSHTAILKDVRVSVVVSSTARVIIALNSGPTFANILDEQLAAGTKTRAAQGFIVLEPGDSIEVFSDVDNAITFWMSGSELAGTAP